MMMIMVTIMTIMTIMMIMMIVMIMTILTMTIVIIMMLMIIITHVDFTLSHLFCSRLNCRRIASRFVIANRAAIAASVCIDLPLRVLSEGYFLGFAFLR